MCNELEMIWKETVVAHFKILSWHLPGGTDENHKKKFGQESQSPDRDLSPRPPKCEAEVLTAVMMFRFDHIIMFGEENKLYEGESNENRKFFFKFNLLNESGTQLYHFST
jgi:hypothetical protein